MTEQWDNQIDRQVAAFLDDLRTASLATVDEAGSVHAANIQYVRDQNGYLYFVSSPESEHSRHIVGNERVALTIFAGADRVDKIHGVQMHGIANIVEDNVRWDQPWKLYAAKFPIVTKVPLLLMIQAQSFYRIRPTWVRWIDNRRGFGFKVDKDLSAHLSQ